MVKYIKSSTCETPEYLWDWVCSNDIAKVKNYYDNGGAVGCKYPKFGTYHSLIMGALRNRNFELANMLVDYGEDVSHKEAREIFELEKKMPNLTDREYDLLANIEYKLDI